MRASKNGLHSRWSTFRGFDFFWAKYNEGSLIKDANWDFDIRREFTYKWIHSRSTQNHSKLHFFDTISLEFRINVQAQPPRSSIFLYDSTKNEWMKIRFRCFWLKAMSWDDLPPQRDNILRPPECSHLGGVFLGVSSVQWSCSIEVIL